MAEKDNKGKTDEGEETVVVGLVKRVFSVETRLQKPTSKEVPDQPEIQSLKKVAKSKVAVETKVMKSPRPKSKSVRTMSDFKV